MISSKAGNKAALPEFDLAVGEARPVNPTVQLTSNSSLMSSFRSKANFAMWPPKRVRRSAIGLGLAGVSVFASAAMIHLHRVHAAAATPKPVVAQPAPMLTATAVRPAKHKTFNPLRGIASWYGSVLHGHTTASGEIFDETKMTAAHNTLPMGTRVRVTDLNSNKSVVVRINDRGELSPGRIIDLTSAAAEQLGILRAGIAPVKVEVIKPDANQPETD